MTTLQEVAVIGRHVAVLHQVQHNLRLKVHVITENLRYDLRKTVNHMIWPKLLLINDYLDMCIDATNEHAKDDPEFQKRIGQMETNDQGRVLPKGFFCD